MWSFIRQHPQVIYLLLALGVPLVARIFKTLGEQAQKRQQGLRREQDELDQLRTGRASPTPVDSSAGAPSARQALEEMAAKRRAQIEELRQRRQAAAAASGNAGAA